MKKKSTIYTLARLVRSVLFWVAVLVSTLLLVLVDTSLGIPCLTVFTVVVLLDRVRSVIGQALLVFGATVAISSLLAISSLVVLGVFLANWWIMATISVFSSSTMFLRVMLSCISAGILFWLAGGVVTWSVLLYALVSCVVMLWLVRRRWLLPDTEGPWYIR